MQSTAKSLSLAKVQFNGARMRASFYAAAVTMGVLVAATTARGDTAKLACTPPADRVWLYDSTTTFNVIAHLGCGETVEVEARAAGYVKVRSAGGQEGFVPLNALPGLPAESSAAAAKDEAPRQLSLVEAAALARHHNAPAAEAAAPAPMPVAVVAAAAPATPAISPAATAPAVAASAAPVARPEPGVAVVARAAVVRPRPAPAPKPVAAPAAAAPEAVAEIVLSTAPDPEPERATQPTPATPAARPIPPAQPAPAAQPAPIEPPPPAAPSAPSSAAMAISRPRVEVAAAAPATNGVPKPATSMSAMMAPAAEPKDAAEAFVTDPAAKLVHTAARTTPEDDDDVIEANAAAKAAALPDCAAYFSAYGLSPNQYKWIETNAKKYPGICPAPSPALVDFVVIFTHDVDFYNFTMPAPVRTDASGLSDWTPMQMEDSALVPVSEMDKNRHEYVWVFHTRRGAFNPARFSSKRQPLFSKSESNTFGSHAGDRTAEDALHFIAENRGSN